MAQYFRSVGANINCEDYKTRGEPITPIHIAFDKGFQKGIEWLINMRWSVGLVKGFYNLSTI